MARKELMSNPYSVYTSVQAETAPRGSLVVMLYQGAIRFGRTAVEAIRRNDLDAAHSALVRMQEIVSELRCTLDRAVGEIADRLDAIYEYSSRRLIEANVKKDPEIVEEVVTLLMDLLPAWVEAARRSEAHSVLERPSLPINNVLVAR